MSSMVMNRESLPALLSMLKGTIYNIFGCDETGKIIGILQDQHSRPIIKHSGINFITRRDVL